MSMIEEGEFIITKEEGEELRVLVRAEHYEIIGPAWMAAVFKFPNENLVLRKRAQVMKSHDGAPKLLPPPEVPDPGLLDWDVNIIRGSKSEYRGVVSAVNYATAITVAIEHYRLNDWQIKRLMVTVRTKPVYR